MKKTLLFIIICYISFFKVLCQNQSGIIIGGGKGNITTELQPALVTSKNNEISYKYNFSIGYLFRIFPSASSVLYLDVNPNLGMKYWKSGYWINYSYDQPPEYPGYQAKSIYCFTSISGTVNYPVYKRLSIGAGVEPTYYFYRGGEASKNRFDIPLIGKVSCNLKIFEIGMNYRYGILNALKTDHIKTGKFSDWQLFVFIPF